jgi:hypothetical protein
MFQLIIKREDESIYWIEYFNNEEAALKWLQEEMTRPYWDITYTYEIIQQS